MITSDIPTEGAPVGPAAPDLVAGSPQRQRRAWKWDDSMARNPPEEVSRLVTENWRLVRWFARRFGTGIGFDAAISVATDGILRAAKTFDPARGSFASHAVLQMRGFLSHEIKRRQTEKRGGSFVHVYTSELQGKWEPLHWDTPIE